MTSRRRPEPDATQPGPEPEPAIHPRRATNTETAIDGAVDSAAHEVARALADEGIGPARVTPRDVLRSRYPSDTFDDEADTEPHSLAPPFMTTPAPEARPVSPAAPRRAPNALEISTPSLSPFAVDPRPTPRPEAGSQARLGPHARQVASRGPGASHRRGRPATFFSRAPSFPWILALMTMGGVSAFVTTQLVRVPARNEPAAPPRAAAVAPRVTEPSTRPDAAADAAPRR